MRDSETLVFLSDPIISRSDMFMLTYSRFIMEEDSISCLPLSWYQEHFSETVLKEFLNRKYLVQIDDGYAVNELLNVKQSFLPIPREMSIALYKDIFDNDECLDPIVFDIYIFFAHKLKTWAYKHYFHTFYFSIKVLCTFLGISYSNKNIKRVKDAIQWLSENEYIDFEEIPKKDRVRMMPYKLNGIALIEKGEYLDLEEIIEVYNY